MAARINDESRDSATAGYPPILVEDFVERCDQLFAAASPETVAEVSELADNIDTSDLYDLVGE